VEECFPAGKNEAGLDHYQVRLCKAWYRYVTLAMLALAWLGVTRGNIAAAFRRVAEFGADWIYLPSTRPRPLTSVYVLRGAIRAAALRYASDKVAFDTPCQT
jgi:hypothetical protein